MLIIGLFMITKEDIYLKDNHLLSSYSVKLTWSQSYGPRLPPWGFSVEVEKAHCNRKPGEKNLIELIIKRPVSRGSPLPIHSNSLFGGGDWGKYLHFSFPKICLAKLLKT